LQCRSDTIRQDGFARTYRRNKDSLKGRIFQQAQWPNFALQHYPPENHNMSNTPPIRRGRAPVLHAAHRELQPRTPQHPGRAAPLGKTADRQQWPARQGFDTMSDTTQSLWLDKAELARLTGYRWKSRQVAHLKASKIPHTVNRLGEPLVVRAVIEGQGGIEKTRRKKAAPTEPNWAAIGLE